MSCRLGSLTVSAPVLADLLELHDRTLPRWQKVEKKQCNFYICLKTYISLFLACTLLPKTHL